MKNSRLSGIIVFVVAILLVGGLTYYELGQLQPQQTLVGNPPESDDLAPPGDKPIVPPASLTAEQPAAAAGGSMAEAPSTPSATDNTMAAAPANPSAPAAETPAASGGAPTEAAANPPAPATTEQPTAEAPAAGTMAPGADNQMAAAPTAPTTETPAAPTPAGAGATPGATDNQMAAAPTTPTTETPAAPKPAAGGATPGAADNQMAAAPAAETPTAPAPATSAPPTDQAKAAPSTGSPAPAGGEQVATAAPPTAAAPEKPAAPAASAPTIPSFDVVRVEPSGETVVAGQAAPESKVEVLDGANAIATATANDRGEWAMALDNALKPGTHDLAIRTTSKDGAMSTLSDQRVAVQVPEPGSKDVLVVLNSPNAPSRVLQLPKGGAPAASGGEQVAAAAPPAAGGTAAQPETPKTGGEVAALEPKSPAAQSPDLVTPKPQPVTSGTASTASATPEPAAGAPAERPAAPATAAAAPPKPAPPKPEVTVSAVEADTAGTLFVAGTAATDQTVRVYLNDQPLGEAKPSPSGTWLVETHHEVAPGSYQVRADQLSGPDGKVVARAEVPFERKIEVAGLKASGDTGAAGGADVSGQLPQVRTVIIKRGDNLWTIARDTWGRGITWSTLYQANKDQIRNPHWIYPGQVFIMPVSPDIAKN